MENNNVDQSAHEVIDLIKRYGWDEEGFALAHKEINKEKCDKQRHWLLLHLAWLGVERAQHDQAEEILKRLADNPDFEGWSPHSARQITT